MSVADSSPSVFSVRPSEGESLEGILNGLAVGRRFALAYSGGLDSRFLAHAALSMGFEPLLLHATGPHIPRGETAFARQWALARKLPLVEIVINALDLPAVAAGEHHRCYACKRELFRRLREATDLPLCDGTNASDAGQFRPGLRAAEETGVFSPLGSAGLTKKDIRRRAAATGLEYPDQPARPCLLTRLNYGLKPDPATLHALEAGEQAAFHILAACLPDDPAPDFRLRLTAPRQLELHLLPSVAASLSPEQRRELIAGVSAAAPTMPEPRLVTPDSLSGFFDSPRAPSLSGSPALSAAEAEENPPAGR